MKEVDGNLSGRMRYVEPWVEPLVYNRISTDVRWHVFDGSPLPSGIEGTLDSIELVRTIAREPLPTGILVLHVTIIATNGGELRSYLDRLTNHNIRHRSSIRDWVRGLVEPWADIHPSHRRAMHVTLATRAGSDWPSLAQPSKLHPADTEMLSLIANSGRYLPDPEWSPMGADERQTARLIRMSNTLRGLVSRDGFALVGLAEDRGGSGGRHGFDYDGAQFFARGLYTDALLVFTQQMLALEAIMQDFKTARKAPTIEAIAVLEAEVDHFRNSIWGSVFAPQGSQTDVLRSLQEIRGLVASESRLSEGLQEFAARVRRDQQEGIALIIRIVTLIGLPSTVVWNLLVDQQVDWRAWFLYALLVLFAVLAVFWPGTRAALGITFTRPFESHLIEWP